MCCSYGIEIVGLMLNQGKFQELKHCSMYSTKNLTGLALFLVLLFIQRVVSIDYGVALTKSLLYYEAQRSGKLPPNQRVEWRGDSGLNDGSDVGTDLVGGYHDAGDNIKFGFPMAFTTTMLAWGVVEFGNRLEAKKEFFNAMQAIKWVTDYMIKAHPQPNVFYGQVGEGDSDHNCWQRPEDMTTLRTAYKIDAEHPGSDLAAETAAALAAASIAFSKCCPFYSSLLVNHSKQLFDFACNYQDLYQNSIPEAARFYYSSGYQDELLWAAAWLHRATGNQSYIDYLASASELSGRGITLSWDNKYVGASILVAKLVLEGKVKNDGIWLQYLNYAEEFVCSCIQKGNNNVKMTPCGLLWWDLSWNSLQYTTSAALAIVAYSDYLNATKVQLQCQGGLVYPADLIAFARSQVDYILGLNPKNMSYMVGFGTKYPEQVHHRGSSIVSIKKDPTHVTCSEGFMRYFHNDAPNPNVLEGALVGGPDENDIYNDSRLNTPQAEASTYITAPFIGVLARVSD